MSDWQELMLLRAAPSPCLGKQRKLRDSSRTTAAANERLKKDNKKAIAERRTSALFWIVLLVPHCFVARARMLSCLHADRLPRGAVLRRCGLCASRLALSPKACATAEEEKRAARGEGGQEKEGKSLQGLEAFWQQQASWCQQEDNRSKRRDQEQDKMSATGSQEDQEEDMGDKERTRRGPEEDNGATGKERKKRTTRRQGLATDSCGQAARQKKETRRMPGHSVHRRSQRQLLFLKRAPLAHELMFWMLACCKGV